MSAKILIVDDEERIIEVIYAYLHREGYKVLKAHDGLSAIELIENEKPSLIVLDLMLPEISGMEVCDYIRQKTDTPIIMLTARVDETDRIAGLRAGADDYVTKPFSPKELVERIKAVLRRSPKSEKIIMSKDKSVKIMTEQHKVTINESTITLTPTEYKLLVLFLEHPGKVFSRRQLAETVFGWDYEGYEETIYVHVKNLRKKIENHTTKQMIHTVYGVGYRWDD